MAALERVLQGLKEVLRMSDEIKRVSEEIKELAIDVRDIDRRLVRIETMAEMATKAGRSAKRLPGRSHQE
ncbi:MAG: hypothetical protein ACREVK_05025 [Gammaproteobacteria bacterium]